MTILSGVIPGTAILASVIKGMVIPGIAVPEIVVRGTSLWKVLSNANAVFHGILVCGECAGGQILE